MDVFDMDLRQAVDAPRLHHGWFPDRIRVEQALVRQFPQTIEQLRDWGHAVAEPVDHQGDAHSIWIDPATGDIVAAADRQRRQLRRGAIETLPKRGMCAAVYFSAPAKPRRTECESRDEDSAGGIVQSKRRTAKVAVRIGERSPAAGVYAARVRSPTVSHGAAV